MSLPTTPRHSRQSTMDSAVSPASRRRDEPLTPSHHLHPSFSQSDGLDMFNSSGIGAHGGSGSGGDGDGDGGGGGGLGNLADELADAFSDGDEDEDDYYYDDQLRHDGEEATSVGSRDGDGQDSDGENDDDNNKDDGGDGHHERDSMHSHSHSKKSRGAGPNNGSGLRDSGVDVASAASPRGAGKAKARTHDMSLAPPARQQPSGHRRAGSEYDGSEYGSDSDLDSPGMPPSLVAKIDLVESLARRGTEDNGGPTDGVCRRLTEELRDLGSQAGVEGGASRLITAHSALTTHLAHQTRQLHTLAFPLFSPLANGGMPLASLSAGSIRSNGPVSLRGGGGGAVRSIRGGGGVISGADDGGSSKKMSGGGGGGIGGGNGTASHGDGADDADKDDEAEADPLLPMLASLAEQMPRPSAAAFQSLTALHALTSDLVTTLNYLSDTLHMARQTTTAATRRLRSAKELVAELRRDDELCEQGQRWLERNRWDERLQQRECAVACRDIVGGFEEVCNGWRARLLAQTETPQAI